MPALNRPLKKHPLRGSSGADLSRDIAHDYRREVGEWIRRLRIAKDLRQSDVGDALGVGFTAVSAIETGRSSVPPERYEALADLLGIDHAEMGKTMLRYSNPWCYALIFGTDRQLRDELKTLPANHQTAARGPRR